MSSVLEQQAVSSRRRSGVWIIGIVCAWVVGFEIWSLTDQWLVRSITHLSVYAAAIAACFFEPVRKGLLALGALLERRGRAATPVIFLVMSLLAIAILYGTALASHRRFFPVFHDEFSYLLQATMLAHGHLSMPAHPLGAFFDTFYVITDRAYASQYFPGAAMMFVPGVWLGLDGWVMPLVIAGAAAGMMFLVMRELFDGLSGLASIFLMVGVLGFRFLSIIPVAQVPALLLGLVATYATLRWIATRKLGWIAGCGTAIGWMAITRPLDAMVYALPLGVLITLFQRKFEADLADWRRLVVAGLVPMVPFLCLQLLINHQVTGNVLQTPFAYYAQRDLPGTSYGFHPYDPTLRPVSPLRSKQVFYVDRVLPTLKDHTPTKVIESWIRIRAKNTAGEMVGDMLLLIPVPAALLCLADPRRWAVVSILLVWCVAYSFYSFSYAHYYVSVLASVPVLIFAGFDSIPRLFPSAWRTVKCLRFLVPSAIAVMVMPQFKGDVMDQFVDNGVEEGVRAFERDVPDAKAILLVRWSDESVPEWEVVYNIHNSWPDDARVIRAHDLGEEKNRALYQYYAARDPQRVVYLYEGGKTQRLGTVTDLAKTSGSPGDSIRTSRAAATPATTRTTNETGDANP